MKLEDVVVYDAEIRRCIPDKNAYLRPNLEYCAGWDDFPNMGISVVCAYDFRERMPRVFLQDNLHQLPQLFMGRCAAGFNNIGFDEKLLAANGIRLPLADGTGRALPSFDLLRAIRTAVGEPEDFTPGVTKPGRKLDDIARANLKQAKSGNGALAPVEWQNHKYGYVIDYCLRDLMLTVRLIEQLPILVDPVTGREIFVNAPWIFEEGDDEEVA